MKNNKFKHISLVVALAAVLFSCTDQFEKYNSNPFGWTEEMMQWDGMAFGARLTQMQINVLPISQQPNFGDERYQVIQNLCGDIFSGYMAAPRYWYAGADNTVYNLYPSWYSQPWDHAYANIMTPWNVLRGNTETSQPQIFAVAQIVKVQAMHRVTDMYGPIPYSEFGKATYVSYDSQQAVYDAFFEELDAAVNTLNEFIAGSPGAKILAEYDYIYGGDPVKWVKLANSLRLRLALRIYFADEAKSRAQAEAALDPANGGVFTENSDNAALKPGNAPGLNFHHPLWEICENFDDIRMGATIDSYMNGYKDPRLEKYFQAPEMPGRAYPTSGGNFSSSITTPTYRGIRTAIDIGADQGSFKATSSKVIASPGNNHSMLWMGAPEVYFLRAEAKLRWSGIANESSSVQVLYETGVAKSMELWGAATGTYLTDATATRIPNPFGDPVKSTLDCNTRPYSRLVPWSGTDTNAQQIERVLIQKWIALYPDGVEAWSEYRRTGVPVLIEGMSQAQNKYNMSGGTIPNTGPLRMPFPSSEYRNNQTGVASGVSLLGGPDHGGTKVWWDKN